MKRDLAVQRWLPLTSGGAASLTIPVQLACVPLVDGEAPQAIDMNSVARRIERVIPERSATKGLAKANTAAADDE